MLMQPSHHQQPHLAGPDMYYASGARYGDYFRHHHPPTTSSAYGGGVGQSAAVATGPQTGAAGPPSTSPRWQRRSYDYENDFRHRDITHGGLAAAGGGGSGTTSRSRSRSRAGASDAYDYLHTVGHA